MLDMASLAGQPQPGGSANHKITKARGKMVVVKPILKKLSHSEKNSLDLDRGWDEQQVEQLETREWDFGLAGGFGAGDASVAAAAGGGSGFRAKFQHGRSGSQTSTASGPRSAFVHPFAQTPRTSTPPLSYANSLASFDNARDYSPTITENEDDDGFDSAPTYPHPHLHPHPPPTVSQSNLRQPLLNGQRTSSFPEIPPPSNNALPSLRVNTSRSVSGATASSRLAHGSSHSDLHNPPAHSLSVGLTGLLDSPTGSPGGGGAGSSNGISPATTTTTTTTAATAPSSSSQTPIITQTTSSASPLLRTSFEMAAAGFPRLRSRSEVDTAARAENIRAARRKFEERERAKEEKYDREMIRKRERRDTKEASRIEKGEAPAAAARSSAHHRGKRRTPPTTTAGLSTGGCGGSSSRNDWGGGRSSSPQLDLPSGSSSAPGPGASGLGVGKGIRRRKHHTAPPMMEAGTGATTATATTYPTTTTAAAAAGGGGGAGAAGGMMGEKQMGFASRKYESVPLQTPPAFGPAVDDVRFEQARPRRGSGAKRKTQSYWQGFLLWLRTKLLRMSGH